MKKTLSIVLLVVLTAVLAVSCATTKSGNDVAEPAPNVVVLNNAFKTLSTSDQCFNAVAWVPCYSVEDIIADNFWFKPSAETVITCFQNNDFGYSDTITYGGQEGHKTAYMAFGFHNRYVAFAGAYKAADPEDFYVGKGGNYTYRAYYTTISVIGNEALVFMQPDFWTDGISMEETINSIKNSTLNGTKQTVADAAEWKFTAVDGSELVLTKAEFEAAVLYSNEDQSLIWVESGDKKLENVRYFAPADLTATSAVEADKVYRFTIAKNAVGVYGVEAPFVQNVQGTYYPTAKTRAATVLAGSYSVAEMLAAYNVQPCETVTVVSLDGNTSLDFTWEKAQDLYIAYHLTNGYTLVGPAQVKGQPTVNKIGYVVAGDTVFVIVPEDGLFVSEIAEVAGVEGISTKLVYTNGAAFELPYDITGDLCLTTDSKVLTVDLF